MTVTIQAVESRGLVAQDTEKNDCSGCVFSHTGTYEDLGCIGVPCTPKATGGSYIIWVKRESPEQGRG